MPALKIGDLETPLPIIQGGMAVRISLSGLSGAVAKEGGIGVIGTAGIGVEEKDFRDNFIEANNRALRNEIQRARELSGGNGLIGVNIMVALTNYDEMVKTSIDAGADVILSGAGLPLMLPSHVKDGSRTKLVPIVSSGRATTIICKRWQQRFNYCPDAVVVEGPLAGGHLGFKREQIDDPAYALELLIPGVLEAVKPYEDHYQKKIPVIPAGGIYTGVDIYKFLQMGAAGVQMATRFVATHECDADIKFKEAYVTSKREDIVIINSPVGLPGRAIKNKFTQDVSDGKKTPFSCPYHCIITCEYETSPYCIAIALTNAQKGKLAGGFAFCGANAHRVDKIISVKELIQELVSQYNEVAVKNKEAGQTT